MALERHDGPTALALTRQKLPALAEAAERASEGVARGAYVLWETGGTPELLLLASGSELHLALEAGKRLASEGHVVRVVSMPSWELFAEQDESYRDAVLPPAVRHRVAVEAASPQGWDRWVGSGGTICGINRFGASAPAEALAEPFGYTADRIAARARDLLAR